MTDIATRAYNHTFKLDPVVRSLMDTDFYKLLMLQFIWAFHGETRVSFGLVNRSQTVRLAEEIGETELREQLDHARGLRFQRKELIWLQGNTFYGKSNIFHPAFIAWLADFALPDYQLDKRDGQYELTFSGPWTHTTMWEIPALAIINELRSRAAIRKLGKFEIDVLYARAKAKLWDKIERLRKLRAEGPLKIADFGTRRRHGFLWQKWCIEALREGVGSSYIGTSNVFLALELGQEAIGTNAHELPMVYAALSDDDAAMRASRYAVLADWAKMYQGNLGVILPDAYGTTSFLADAPDWIAGLKGARPDSKDPIEGGEEIVAWWRARGEDPMRKLLVLSDAMDIGSIETCVRHFRGVAPISIGWGTNLTNDFVACSPRGDAAFEQISVVCKAVEANGRPVVKLSDNFAKATGPKAEIERYARIFGTAGIKNRPVAV